MNALNKTFSRASLTEAWSDMKGDFSKSTTPGIDKVTRTHFANNIDAEIASISRRVKANRYRFSPLKPIPITKEDGSIRLINVPTIADRFVQRVMLRFFAQHYGAEWKLPNSFSSLKDMSEGTFSTLRSIQESVAYKDWIIRADLSKYFDTIDRKKLFQEVKRRVRHRSFHRLIEKSICVETSTETKDHSSIFSKSGLISGKGIRQGMPISPVFAFLYLAKFDEALSSAMFRYVDDMLFFDQTKDSVIQSFESYVKSVEKLGLNIHPLSSSDPKAKTALISPTDNFVFLGIKLVREESGIKFQIPSNKKESVLENALNSCAFPGTDKKKQVAWLISSSSKASGLVRDYKTAYGICEDWHSFECSLKQTQKAMCRKIAKEISMLSKNKDDEKLMRVFGII